MMPGQVFVFGSNLAGRHGGGAAKYAALKFGAIYGQGEGRQGQSYAIPTKDGNLRTLPLDQIEIYARRFAQYAALQHHEGFLLTPIGCGLAGHKVEDIWAMFHRIGLPYNVQLAPQWITDHSPTTAAEKEAGNG